MALATITETLATPAGGSAHTLRAIKVRLRCIAAEDGAAVAYASAVTTVAESWTRPDGDGTYTFTDVRPNSGVSGDVITDPAETVYELSLVYPDGTRVVRYLDVPDSTGPHSVGDIDVPNPNTIRRWRTTDLYDVDNTAATTTGHTLVWDDVEEEWEPGQVPTAGIADDAVTAAKIATGAVGSAEIASDAVGSDEIAAGAVGATELASDAVTTAKIAAEAVTSSKVDHTVEVVKQGRRWTGLTAWEAAWANVTSAPVKMVVLGDSHVELGTHEGFFTKARARVPAYQLEPNALSSAGSWVPAYSAYGLIGGIAGSHSGAAASTAGPAGYAAEIDTGEWVQFGGWAFSLNTGFKVYGVGDFDISVNGGAAVPTTLAAGDVYDTGVLSIGANTIRLTATSDDAVVWGAYMHLYDNSSGFQPWAIGHSGWKGSQMLAVTETWDLLEAIDPHLVVIGFGTNQTSASDYLTDIEDLIQQVQTTTPDADIAIWFPQLASASGDDEDWWTAAESHAKDLARTYGCALINNYAVMGDVSAPNDTFGLSDDDTHLSTKGMALSSSIMAGVLLGSDQTVKPVDATGTIPTYSIRFKEIYTGAGDVTLLGGSATASQPCLLVTDTSGSTLRMVIASDPQSGSEYNNALLPRLYADKRYRLRSNALLPSGALVESLPRNGPTYTNQASALVSGRIHLVAVELVAGQVVSSITFVSSTTALSAGTNQWFLLADSSRVVLRRTSDDTSTAWGSSTAKTLNLTSSYTVTTTGLYYVGIMVAASTVPSLLGVNGGSIISGIAPVVNGYADTGMTTRPAEGATLAAITSHGPVPYCYLS